MAPQRLSKSRFQEADEASPKSIEKRTDDTINNLGLTHVDSAIAIGQSGGVVVVMQELHDESAFDTGDFAVSKSRFDKRKETQKEREAQIRRQKEEERKAALALKKEQEAKAAREAAEAKEAARKAAVEERNRREQEARKQARAAIKKEKVNRGPVPAPPPIPAGDLPEPSDAKKASAGNLGEGKGKRLSAPNPPAQEPTRRVEDGKVSAPHVTEASRAILQDSAVVGIGTVISKAPRVESPRRKHPVHMDASSQTDPVRILPIEQSPKMTTSGTSAAAAWWLQQAASGAAAPPAQVSQPAPQQQATSAGDQYMMQAYIDAMQRMTAPTQGSSYGYWTAPATQAPSAADMYWQQQQNVYQSAPRYTAPRRIP